VLDEDDDEEFKRQKDDRDPEVDADFDRELAKLMSDSMDSRKLERKNLFDVPLPMRRTQREVAPFEDTTETPIATPSVVKFSLLTKRGNRQQVVLCCLYYRMNIDFLFRRRISICQRILSSL
jgi:regulator of nonsense transcripts 2